MAVNRKHLRQISQNAVGSIGVAAAAIGAAVPANRIRIVFFVKVWHSNPVASTITFYRDGAAGVIVMDTIHLGGTGAPGAADVGKPWDTFGKDIEMPVWVLREGEQIGAVISVGAGGLFVAFYDEEG